MIFQEQAEHLAREWIAAWNAHDLDRILTHYGEQVEFHSPLVEKILGDAHGVVQGKAALREYFRKGLASYPQLTFHLYKILVGVRSVTLYYLSVNNRQAAEVMELDEHGLVIRVLAHYAETN